MDTTYYLLRHLPDLSLSKYTALDHGDLNGVLEKHAMFWRQMHRRGILQGDAIHLFYEYDPARPAGHRLAIGFRFDTDGTASASFIAQTVTASPLCEFYELFPFDSEKHGADKLQLHRTYAYQAHLIKKETFRSSLRQQDGTAYYITSQWEMNSAARLHTMASLMEAIGLPCVYCVSVYPRDMTETMEQALRHILVQLRQDSQMSISSRPGKLSLREKDENADSVLDFYEDLLDSLAENPHFIVDVQVLSDDLRHASCILDAAAAESIGEGAHELRCFQGAMSLAQIGAQNFFACADERAPTALRELPHLFLLEQLVPFATLPALYPGEQIELPKESAPPAQPQGILLGCDNEGHEVRFPLENLCKHAFLGGVPGSGKTNSMMHLIAAMHGHYGIPVLVLEPAKHEYRALAGMSGMEDLELFSPGACTRFPLHINPFEFPLGMPLAEHIRNLLAVFDGAFALEPPMPFLLDSAVEEIYRDNNWVPAMINTGQLRYPTMRELYRKLEIKLEKTDYAPEIQGNLKSALQVRIGSLLTREMGDIFDVPWSTIPPGEWISRSAIVELEAIGTDQANFTTLLLATFIRESLKLHPYKKEADGRPRHVMFFEEAHNLIGPNAMPKSREEADPKTAATAYIVKMLAEVRALGEGIVIADQLPTAMAPEVIKNTSLKIGLRITAQDDRELLGGTMNANPDQMEKMGVFSPGHALVSYEPLLKPFEVQLPFFSTEGFDQDDGSALERVGVLTPYGKNLERSLAICTEKWDAHYEAMQRREEKAMALWQQMQGMARQDEKTSAEPGRLERFKRTQKELYAELDLLMEEATGLVVDIAAYKASFAFLDEAGAAMSWDTDSFRMQLMQQLCQAVRYQRALTGRIRDQGIPLGNRWEQLYIQRKDLLLRQGRENG